MFVYISALILASTFLGRQHSLVKHSNLYDKESVLINANIGVEFHLRLMSTKIIIIYNNNYIFVLK